MSAVAVLAGALAVAAAIALLSSRLPAVVAAAAGVLLVGIQLLPAPLPGPPALAGAAVGAALASEILWLRLRGRTLTGTLSLGWPALAVLAGAGFVVGDAVHQAAPGAGSAEALGAGVALAIVAGVAAVGRPDGVALGLSALVFTAAAAAICLGLSGPATPLWTVIVTTVGIALAGAVALLAGRSAGPVERSPRAGTPS